MIEAIRNRRSVFPAQYSDRPIPKETIESILESANWAPNHKKTEPWRFKVMTGEKKTELGQFLSKKYEEVVSNPKRIKIKKLLENPPKAGAIVAICMQRDATDSLPEWEEIAATSMAVQNMWLHCTELGIGAYWSSPGLIKYMDEFFDLQEGERCLGFFYMGYYDEAPPKVTRGPIAEKVEWLD